MRTRKGHKTALLVAATGALFLGASMAQAANIVVGNGGAEANATGTISVTLQTEGEGVVGTLNDIQFPAGAQIAEETGAETTLTAALDAATTTGNVAVADASGLPDFGTVKIDDEVISYGSKDGNNLVLAGRGQNGTTAAAHASGATVDPLTLPACAMSAALGALNKSAVFSFIPDGCTPGTDCEGVRGIVIALDNLGEITDGTVLYTCSVKAGATDGDFDLTCPAGDGVEAPFAPAQAAPPPDGALLDTTCASGTFTVGAQGGCVGDCNSNDEVTLGEVQRSFNVFLGANLTECQNADENKNGEVTLGEVQRAFNTFLGTLACPLVP